MVRIISWGIDGHTEERTRKRSFETLDAALHFADGKDVVDIYRNRCWYVVEYKQTKYIKHD